MKNTNWDRKKIRRGAWNTTFRRGAKAWFTLVAVCFVFAFLGVSETSQVSFVKDIDHILGLNKMPVSDNVLILEEYIVRTPVVKDVPFITSNFAVHAIDVASNNATWIIKLLGTNPAYFERNTGEVVVTLLLAALITALIHFFIQNAAIIGKHRYVMECRYSDDVSFNRIFAPYHRKNLPNIIMSLFVYRVVLSLWWLTIVGGVYKTYQYRFVPYILAENPSVKWREAKKLSKEMTDGHKWDMFLTDLSCLYITILKVIPVVGICVAVPYWAEINAEMYFALRDNVRSNLFVENAFSLTPFIKGEINAKPIYVMEDMAVELPEDLKKKCEYKLTDFIVFFFTFCFIGWLWEVSLHIVRNHEFVNRGTMYGPWLPIYGVGGVAIIFLLDRFKANKLKLFSLTVLLCGIIEFAASWILDFFYNSHYWNYKNLFMNLNGRICFAGLTAFGLGGLFGVYIAAPKLSEFAHKLKRKTLIILCVLLCVAFAADLVCCAIFGFNTGAGVGGAYK